MNTSNTKVESKIPDKIYSLKELCKELSISRQTAYNWIKIGVLKRHYLGGKVFFLGSEILQEIQNERSK